MGVSRLLCAIPTPLAALGAKGEKKQATALWAGNPCMTDSSPTTAQIAKIVVDTERRHYREEEKKKEKSAAAHTAGVQVRTWLRVSLALLEWIRRKENQANPLL